MLPSGGPRHPATLITAGHSHRHRRHTHGPLVITEVGSIKDFPGTWAGYVAYEAGIRQVVQRIAGPRRHRVDRAHRGHGPGPVGPVGPGRLSARSFVHTWPR